jgi:hypothetical protein
MLIRASQKPSHSEHHNHMSKMKFQVFQQEGTKYEGYVEVFISQILKYSKLDGRQNTQGS